MTFHEPPEVFSLYSHTKPQFRLLLDELQFYRGTIRSSLCILFDLPCLLFPKAIFASVNHQSPAKMDYSFATEYDGPPLAYTIPRAIPLDLSHIPMASQAPASSSSIPVVHPLSSPLLSKNNDSTFSPTSVIETGVVMDRSAELTDEAAETSGPVELSGSESKRVSTENGVDDEDDFDFRSSGEDNDDEHDFLDGAGVSSRSKQRGKAIVMFRDRSPIKSHPTIKKWVCSNCLKGNRFTDKESCLACERKYCSDCVIQAMGSMPEGRKCIKCIGHPISESKRDKIGKCSRVLKKLLSSLEVEQVMIAERDCEANKLRPEDVFVNNKRLSPDEMTILQNSPHPPPRLKPGFYWYDKVSGYWGKNGHKPCKIITANLSVGGELEKDASNGNTGISINGREITKSELKMLKWAGVQCAGKPQFWVNPDGSYLEEGQSKIIGHLWNKPIMKLLCPVLSLPTPASSSNPNPLCEKYIDFVRKSVPYYTDQKSTHKLLLLGSNGSGTSTIFKQAKFLYKTKPFSEEELYELKTMIQSSVYKYMAILLEGREIFEEMSDNASEYELSSANLRGFSDWLLKVMASGNLEAVFPAATREYAPRVEELWRDSAIQATFKRKDELRLLPSCASYFLERIGEICRMDYEPSKEDILRAAGLTLSNGVVSADVIFPPLSDARLLDEDSDRQESLLKYQLIRIHHKGLSENCKWLDMFEEVRIVIFTISLSDYDEFYEDSETTVPINKMIKSKDLFEKVVTHPAFEQTDFFLILNKSDLLEEKLEKTPLSSCDWFCDFHPLISRNRTSYSNRNLGNNNSSLGQMATHYIGVKFKRLFSNLSGGNGKKLYVMSTNSLDSKSVDSALRYSKEIVKWEDEKPDFNTNDSVYTMTEPTSYSH